MNKSVISLLLILAFLPLASPAQVTRPGDNTKPASMVGQSQAPAYEIPISVKTLANGMQIIVLPDTSVPLVTIELAVRNGSKNTNKAAAARYAPTI